MVLGTPNHLPPEILLGGKADVRSDVWALGVVLYEMVSGKLPFGGGSLAELAGAIVHGEPTPLSGSVPIGIRAVISRCLSQEPGQRYRQGGEVRTALETLLQTATPKRAGGVSRRIWLPAAGLALVALAVALAFAVIGLRDRNAERGDRSRIGSLAVLPLANLSGDPDQEYFADGMTEELITDLAPIRSLKVISRTSVMRFKNSKEPLRKIASQLGVDAIIEGSVQRAGDRVRITAQLIEASSDRHLWAKSYERDFRDVLALQSQVALDIAHEIQLQVSPQVSARLESRRPVNPEGYELYLKGRYEWNKVSEEGVRKSIEYFNRALAIDPGDARYSSGLADAYLVLVQVVGGMPVQEGMAKVKEYARRALAADEGSAEAHASMGAALFFGDWNWTDSERHIKRAIELNPGYSTAHVIYSAMLAAGGRINEAIEQDRLAMGLDPLSLIANWNAVGTLFLARRYEEAIAQAKRTAGVVPGSSLPQGALLRVYEQQGDYEAALNVLEKHLPEKDGGKAYAAKIRRAYSASGVPGYWRAVRDRFLGSGNTSPPSPVAMAMVYTRLGDSGRAIEYLERAYSEHEGDMLFINVEPCFDALRSDPRFQSLVRRVGLTPRG